MAIRDPETLLNTVIEGIGQPFYALDPEWRVTFYNEEAARYFQRPAHDVLGRNLWDVFPGDAAHGRARLLREAMAGRQLVKGETPSMKDGRIVAYCMFPLGDGLGVTFRDITEQHRYEQHLKLVLGELNHRVKNTLAIVQSIAVLTFKGADPVARTDFQERLRTLGAVHSLLTARNWESAGLSDIVQTTIGTHRGGAGDRVRIDGKDFCLRPKSAVSVSMALHELATNALKYGALSNDRGHVDVTWREADGRFRMTWRECGGPAVSPPASRGFGSRMIEQGLASELQGEVRIEFRPEGVVCTIDAPIEAILDGA